MAENLPLPRTLKPPKRPHARPSWISIAFVALLAGVLLKERQVVAVIGLGMVGGVLYLVFEGLSSQLQWRRARIHMSTALALMLVASLLLWANTTENGPPNSYTTITRSNVDLQKYRARVVYYGWPFHATTYYKPVDKATNGQSFTNPLVLLNLGFAIGLLYAVGFACEERIRRKSKSGE